jgi:pimeloyl-ACP methyl ester carboxylesterase
MTPFMQDIVVVIPGILGSVLRKHGEVIWGYSAGLLARNLITRGQQIGEALALSRDPIDVDDLGDGVTVDGLMPDLHLLPKLWKIDGYGRLTQRLKQEFALVDRSNYFEFPYDWRRDNRVAARQLARASKSWIERRRQTVPDAKLVLIAHSMGGLVARHFLEMLGGWRDTRALITFGTPFRGSLNALDALANGIHEGPFGVIDLSQMARSFTSIYQLLPIYPCLDAGGMQPVRVSEAKGIPDLSAAKAADALQFHRDIMNAVKGHEKTAEYASANRYRIHPIVGTAQNTAIGARWNGTEVTISRSSVEQGLGGDGTVPRVSATPVELGNAGGEMFTSTKHGSLQNADTTMKHLLSVLASLRLDLGDFLGPAPVAAEEDAAGTLELTVDDLTRLGETVNVAARPSGAVRALSADVVDEHRHVVRSIELHVDEDGTWHGAYVPEQPGGFRVRVTGAGFEPVEDSFAVAASP